MIEKQKLDAAEITRLTKFPIQRLFYVMESIAQLKSDVEQLRRKNEKNFSETEKINGIQRCLNQAILEVDKAINNIEQIPPGVEEYICVLSQ